MISHTAAENIHTMPYDITALFFRKKLWGLNSWTQIVLHTNYQNVLYCIENDKNLLSERFKNEITYFNQTPYGIQIGLIPPLPYARCWNVIE